jgi:hypothetical protein
VKYLEEDAGSAPVGAFLALSGRKTLTPELDLGWQRDSEELFGESFTLNTFTAVAGPKVNFATEGAVRPVRARRSAPDRRRRVGYNLEQFRRAASTSRPERASPSASVPTSRCSSMRAST